jgi:hypothetical protein
MRKAALLFALAVPALFVPHSSAAVYDEHPRVPWSTPNPAYPLKIRILSVDRHYGHHGGVDYTQSYGSGNLLSDPQVGFDYTSDCLGGFTHNAEEEDFYQGKWKQQDRKLEILMVEAGEKNVEKCTINVTLKPAPYTKKNPPPHLVTAR